jgi:5-formyltetrahydrofolate cyclo-ligase
VIKANPDRAQLPVRANALAAGKTVYMAVPKLADRSPFYLLDPDRLDRPPAEVASPKISEVFAPKVTVAEMPPIDLVVCGSVAVNQDGVRVGKGAGYADIELALLTEAGVISPYTTIITTVHSLQVLTEPLPETTHDFRVDVIVTPERTLVCERQSRPHGLVWEHLSAEKINSIPALGAHTNRHC